MQNTSEIDITVTGRTSGRTHSYPIWFALDGNKLYLIPVKGSDTEWYKNLRKTPTIRLATRGGKTLTASPRLITDEAQLENIEQGLRAEGPDQRNIHPSGNDSLTRCPSGSEYLTSSQNTLFMLSLKEHDQSLTVNTSLDALQSSFWQLYFPQDHC